MKNIFEKLTDNIVRRDEMLKISGKGFDAYKNGKAKWECPYTKKEEVELWLEGYNFAAEKNKK